MKKRNLILDFTSLLDVIMIILYAVLSQQKGAFNEQTKQLENVQEQYESQIEVYEELASENIELSERISELEEETKELRYAAGRYGSTDREQTYDDVMGELITVKLLIGTHINENTNGSEAEISVFMKENSDEEIVVDKFVISHDTGLDDEQRKQAISKAKIDFTNTLYELLLESEGELFLFTIEYNYDDPAVSSKDFEIIEYSINELGRKLDKKCYIEKVKK